MASDPGPAELRALEDRIAKAKGVTTRPAEQRINLELFHRVELQGGFGGPAGCDCFGCHVSFPLFAAA